jgi:CHAD domain-containing protein
VLNLGKVSINLKKQLHHCRKSLKVIFYLINLFPPGTLFSKKQVKHLDAFLDKLGRWHDFEIVFDKIKNYRKDYLAKSLNEYEALKKIETDIKAKRDKLFYRLKPQVIINELKS